MNFCGLIGFGFLWIKDYACCDIGKLIIEICFCKLSVLDYVSFCVSFSH
jgi:hypothetical protein